MHVVRHLGTYRFTRPVGAIRTRRGRNIPLGSLGTNPAQGILTSAPGIAASVGTPAAIAAAGGIGTAAGLATSIAVPVAGVVIGALIGSLFAAHAQRVKDATAENQNLNSLIPTVIQAISAVFQQANSGACSASDAINALQQIQTAYWQAVANGPKGPGIAGGPQNCLSSAYGPWKAGTRGKSECGKSCTASCCIGCDVVEQWITRATWMFQHPGQNDGWAWGQVIGNKYNLQNFSPPNWGPFIPAPGTNNGQIALPGAAALSSVSSIASATVLGIPLWMIAIVGVIGAIAIFHH